MIEERINALRAEMKKRGIDIYYIPTSDFHETEYVSGHFKAREYMTGFTGSAGVAVVTHDMAGLWTDGRYFIQAEKQLSGTPVKLFRMAEEGVPTVEDFIANKITQGGCVGFDGRVVNAGWGKKLAEKTFNKAVKFHTDEDLVGLIWEDRPALPAEPVTLFEEKYSGCPTHEKLKLIREDMKAKGANAHVLSSIDNICWLFNIRGNDISHFPAVLSYALVDMDSATLFVNPKTITKLVEEKLHADGVRIWPYDGIFEFMKQFLGGAKVLLDSHVVNLRLYDTVKSVAEIIDEPNPEVIRQATKNEVELENIKKAHVKDGIACTKFMYWLKKNIGKMQITELSAQDYLADLRAAQPGFLDLSFDTISAYGPNAAMMHYSATPESFSELKPEGFLLVDSGGHYLEGSTDITRTFALGPLSSEQKKMYTLVLKGNMALANAHFIHGCTGMNLDILARGPLWDLGLDYRCGTGHGVGYRLNIHEAPNGIRWRKVPERNDSCVLEEGMVTTDEPGYYEEGAYGIRIENELICRKGEKTEYGQFMEFENITYCPIDLDAIDESYLTNVDKQRINAYHRKVFETLAPYFEGEELKFLKEYTRKI